MAMHLYQELSSNELFPNDVIFDGRGHLTIGHRLLQAKRTGYPYVVITGKKVSTFVDIDASRSSFAIFFMNFGLLQVLETIPKVEVHDIYNATTFYLTHNELFNFFKSIKQSISF